MNKSLKWIGIVVAAMVLIFLFTKMVGSNDAAVKVTAEEVKQATLVETVSASGKLYPETEVRLGAGISGEVTELFVMEGDSVKKGQVLAKLRTDGNRGGINLSALTGVVPNIAASQGSSVVTITSPISGIVSMVNIRKGERAGGMQLSGSELMRIADLSVMELRVDVNENDVIKVKKGDSASVEVDAYNRRRFSGVVSSIASSTQKREATPFSSDITNYEVRIRLDSNSYKDLLTSGRSFPFRSGMNARAEISTRKKENVLAVPVSAVTTREKELRVDEEQPADQPESGINDAEEIVWVVKQDGQPESRVVTTGIQDINFIEILSGLKPGEKVITGPYLVISKGLPEGKKVKIVSRKELFQ